MCVLICEAGTGAESDACATFFPLLSLALLGEETGRTKSSSAAPKESFLGESFMFAFMSMRLSVFLASLLNSASNVDRKGLRDIGLLSELGRWSGRLAGEWRPGDTALLRNGLLEERLMDRPGDGRRSVIRKRLSVLSCFVTAPTHSETSDGWGLTWH
jgi:hypothetical protein